MSSSGPIEDPLVHRIEDHRKDNRRRDGIKKRQGDDEGKACHNQNRDAEEPQRRLLLYICELSSIPRHRWRSPTNCRHRPVALPIILFSIGRPPAMHWRRSACATTKDPTC